MTGVGTAKGLRIARALYETGHIVVGADFQPLGISVHARFSEALKKYYWLRLPSPGYGATLYIRDVVDLAEKEKTDLWINCSELMSPGVDGQTRNCWIGGPNANPYNLIYSSRYS